MPIDFRPATTPARRRVRDGATRRSVRRPLAATAAAIALISTLAGPAGPAAAAPPADCRLPAPVGVFNEHEGPTDYDRWLRPTSTVRGIVLFVDFPDATPTATERGERVNLLGQAPQWFATSSYGRMTLPLTFDNAWRRMPRSHTAYAGYNTSFDAHRAYLRDAVLAADAVVDFSQYQIVYVVPPRSATTLSNSPALIASPTFGVIADGVELRHGVTFGQDLDVWGFKVLNHETGHVIGLPDLYSYSGVPNIQAAVGGWDLMGYILGPAPDLLAWHKWKAGWLDDTQIACRTAFGQTTTTLTPLGGPGGVKAMVVRVANQRAVVVENRQVGALDVAAPCFRSGVLVYTVDSSVGGGANPVTVHDRTPGSALAGCDPAHAQLDNAALTAIGHEVVVSGVRVRLTGATGANRQVRVTW
jgi:M6 family metalloprotease-like protein